MTALFPQTMARITEYTSVARLSIFSPLLCPCSSGMYVSGAVALGLGCQRAVPPFASRKFLNGF